MHPKPLAVFDDISFNPRPLFDIVGMEPLDPGVFDLFCEDGWCYWADAFFRKNYQEWRGQNCRVVVVRIRISAFSMSKSQRKCLRRNQGLDIRVRPIRIEQIHEDLFEKHTLRFDVNRPQSSASFFSEWSHMMPAAGFQLELWDKDRLVAASFFHVGAKSVMGNYCIYDPNETEWQSLGMTTMLIELQMTAKLKREFYYPGLVYDIPSEFNYKLNFNGLEYFDWWGNWYPLPRVPLSPWRAEWGHGLPADQI